ncbi:hypothetical protein SOVF_103260 [Spinacia oleracea]|nr:hypothetical protein SOVF_103260 [Spinacia oleracea]
MAQCTEPTDAMDGECSGFGCCQASIPSGILDANVSTNTFRNRSLVRHFNPCTAAFVVAKDAFKFYRANLSDDINHYNALQLPLVLDWGIGQQNCSSDDGSYLCKDNSECNDPEHALGYRCKCKHGYSGNPYLPQGCKDVNECLGGNHCEKSIYCNNIDGGYYCKCPSGYHGNGTKTDPCISSRRLAPVLVGTERCLNLDGRRRLE